MPTTSRGDDEPCDAKNDSKRHKKLSHREMKVELLKRLRSGPQKLDALAEHFGVSKDGVVRLAAELKEVGYNVAADGAELSLLRDTEERPVDVLDIREVRDVIRIAVVDEIRIGTVNAQLTLLHTLYEKVFPFLGVKAVVAIAPTIGKVTATLTQDILPELRGMSKAAAAEFILDYVVRNFPKGNGLKTYFIGGLRETKLETDDGLELLRAICGHEDRSDLKFSGNLRNQRPFRVGPAVVEFMSAYDDHSPRSISYGPQKLTDHIASRPKPDFVVVGGMHCFSELPDYGKHGAYTVSTPSLHLQMTRQERRGVSPEAGCLILEFRFKPDGTLESFSPIDIILNNYIVADDCLESLGNVPVDAKLTTKRDRAVQWKLLKRFAEQSIISEGALSRELDLNRTELRRHLEQLQAYLETRGRKLERSTVSKEWELEPKTKRRFHPLPLRPEDLFHLQTREAVLSDNHLGSLHDRVDLLARTYDEAIAFGARRMYNAGDIDDGSGMVGYRGHHGDVKPEARGETTLANYVCANWPCREIPVDPKWPLTITVAHRDPKTGALSYTNHIAKDGVVPLQTSLIAGNHPQWAYQTVGYCSTYALANEFPKYVHFIGSLERSILQSGSFEHDGVDHELVHLDGGMGYSLSVQPQKQLDAAVRRRGPSTKPCVIYCGHLHSAFVYVKGDYIVYLLPCQKDPDEFHVRHGFTSSIGAFFTEIYTDKNGRLSMVKLNYRNYRHVPRPTATEEKVPKKNGNGHSKS